MKVILRDPPLWMLLIAIALNLSIRRAPERRAPRAHGWLSRQIDRIFEWRESLARRA